MITLYNNYKISEELKIHASKHYLFIKDDIYEKFDHKVNLIYYNKNYWVKCKFGFKSIQYINDYEYECITLSGRKFNTINRLHSKVVNEVDRLRYYLKYLKMIDSILIINDFNLVNDVKWTIKQIFYLVYK